MGLKDETEGRYSVIAQDDFHGEHHPGNRRVERGGDTASGAAGHQRAQAVRGNVQQLAAHGADAGTDLNDRSLTSRRASRTDADGRGEDLHDAHPFSDPAAAKSHGFHGFRDTRTAGLAGDEKDDRADDEPSERGCKDLDVQGRSRDRLEKRGAAGTEEQPLHETDHVTENDGAVTAQYTDQYGDEDHHGVVAAAQDLQKGGVTYRFQVSCVSHVF